MQGQKQFLEKVAPEGFEPTTPWLKAMCSAKLSYGAIFVLDS